MAGISNAWKRQNDLFTLFTVQREFLVLSVSKILALFL